ncbi:septum formation family protein [Microbacterium sp.]|uniref:septum formation family protein n=1 Tax=Microbacterium sp. TaxID=51671 RepID=UPI0025D47E8B|nr:septum formation family protein [Microbacterium sp.]
MARRTLALGVVILMAGLSLTGCSAIFGLVDAVTRDDTDVVADGSEVDVFSIKIGDCLGETTDGTVSTVVSVPCGQEHEGEVFHDFTLPEGDFPGADSIEASAYDECESAFLVFVGLSYQESALDYIYYSPTEESWNEAGDRVISCVIVDPAGPVTGSLKSANR